MGQTYLLHGFGERTLLQLLLEFCFPATKLLCQYLLYQLIESSLILLAPSKPYQGEILACEVSPTSRPLLKQ